jgi:hypothetical protein
MNQKFYSSNRYLSRKYRVPQQFSVKMRTRQIPPDNRILKRLYPPEVGKTRAKASIKPNKAEAAKMSESKTPQYIDRQKACRVFGSMLANALKQLTTLKSGQPAPSTGLLENAEVW